MFFPLNTANIDIAFVGGVGRSRELRSLVLNNKIVLMLAHTIDTAHTRAFIHALYGGYAHKFVLYRLHRAIDTLFTHMHTRAQARSSP